MGKYDVAERELHKEWHIGIRYACPLSVLAKRGMMCYYTR